MPLKPAPILISDSVYHILSKFSKSRTLPARQVERAKIFILCADGLNNLQISEKVSIGQDSVSKWRTRFLKSLPLLREIEEKNPTELEYGENPPASRPLLASVLRKNGQPGNSREKSE